MATLYLAAAVFVAACGGSGGSETTYWRMDFAGGSSQVMSLHTDGKNVAGWAQYGDGTFQHFTGTENVDGTVHVSAYNGLTLTISGNSMTATNYKGNRHLVKINEAEFTAAGGPTGFN